MFDGVVAELSRNGRCSGVRRNRNLRPRIVEGAYLR